MIGTAPTNRLSCPVEDLEMTPLSNRVRSIETDCQKRQVWKPGMVIPLTEEGMALRENKTTKTRENLGRFLPLIFFSLLLIISQESL